MSDQARDELLADLRRKAAQREAGREDAPGVDLVGPAEAPQLLDVALDDLAGLRRALARRTVIGQATGILMERASLTAEAAFAVLARLSQEQNRKLYELCCEVVEAR